MSATDNSVDYQSVNTRSMSSNGETDGAKTMDLSTAIEETQIAVNLFLNNHFGDARNRFEPWADSSCYHALGYCTMMYIQAAMTFEPRHIDAAVDALKRSVEVCNKQRKKQARLKWNKVDYNTYTDEEVHAELCYAECLLQRALVTFIQDENLVNFVKGGLKIRACYNSYKECRLMLEKRTWSDETSRVQFESGVRFGIGTFNLMISLLPTRILKLLEFVGFSGNRELGLSELEKGRALEETLRSPLCATVLVGYHSVISFAIGMGDGDIPYSNKALKPCLDKYPGGAIFLFFAGRLKEIEGETIDAIYKFEESINSQSEWKQFHHICHWELMWCYAFRLDWLMACRYAEILYKESRWSRATYAYLKASFLCMMPDPTADTILQLQQMFTEIPDLKQKIAGKSIPFEKWAVHKSKFFLDKGNRLTVPGLELIYVWNGFNIVGKDKELIGPMLELIEKTLNTVEKTKAMNSHYGDDFALNMLLKGMCLKFLDRPLQAEVSFREVIECEKQIQSELYLVPFAMTELGVMLMDHDKLDEAKELLLQAKNYKKTRQLQARLHFRIHAAMNTIRYKLKNKGDKQGAAELEISLGSEDLSDQGFAISEESIPSD
uniref:Tetratricopeptide repeat protein 39B-like n=1 Tax=Saccoglossus kowalevskii TaxID=10224 RepID=A0ABM0GVE4_SACKO|nr:PREDICTED: tetratricopeptide repeat protein 39B-like [Saccoglossus kowalevskii]